MHQIVSWCTRNLICVIVVQIPLKILFFYIYIYVYIYILLLVILSCLCFCRGSSVEELRIVQMGERENKDYLNDVIVNGCFVRFACNPCGLQIYCYGFSKSLSRNKNQNLKRFHFAEEFLHCTNVFLASSSSGILDKNFLVYWRFFWRYNVMVLSLDICKCLICL